MNRYTQFRILQVSDCHVAADASAPYRGQNADRNLESLLPAMRLWQPDLILLTGDVSEDASPASYGRVSARLDSVGAPVVALPGNHDDPAIMSRYFPNGPWNGPYFRSAKGWQLALLDSTERNVVDGVLGEDDLSGLKKGLARTQQEHVLIALHHQPVPVGSGWIDKYRLSHPEKLFKVLDGDKRIRVVTWGHIHQEFEGERDGVRLLGSPSSVANSLPGKDRFTLDLRGPSCRWFSLRPDGDFETGLLGPRGEVPSS